MLDGAEPTSRTKRYLKNISLAVIVLLAVAASVHWVWALTWPKLHDTTTAAAASAMGTVFGAVFGLLSAIASAAAAVAAYRAAKHSDDTARRAGEALGMALKPDLIAFVNHVTGYSGTEGELDYWQLVVRNRSYWPAVDVIVYEPGKRGEPLGDIPYLPPARHKNPTITPKPQEVMLRLADVGGRQEGFGEPLIVEFSDERRLLKWKTFIKTQQDYKTERVPL